MHTATEIHTWVQSIPDTALHRLYRLYVCGASDHLMRYPRRSLSSTEQRHALEHYLEQFTLRPDPRDEERPPVLRKIVHDKDVDSLLSVVAEDQFYLEPLYHIANRMQ